MARSVTFNGVTRYTPGGITKVNAEALNQVGITSTGSVALIGEADGGAPGATSGLVVLRDPSRATQMFRSGPLANAIRLAFQSSGDPRIPGGASEVVIYKTNESTRSTVQVPDLTEVVVDDTAAAGSTTTSINLTTAGLTDDAHVGRWVGIAINSLPVLAAKTCGTGSSTTRIAVSGLTEGQYVGKMLQFGATTTTASLKNKYATIVANDGAYLYLAEALAAAPANTDTFDVLATYRVRVTGNTASALTVTPALPVAPAASDGINVYASLMTLTSTDYGAHTANTAVDLVYDSDTATYQATVSLEGRTQISTSLGGTNFLQMYYRGGANAVSTDTILTPATVTSTAIDLTTGGLTASAHAGATVVVTNPATGNSEQVVVSTNGTTSLTLEYPGLSPEFVSELQSSASSTVLVDIKTVTKAVAKITGASGVATTLSTTITGVTGDDLSLTISASETINHLVDRINSNTNYVASVPSGVNGDTALASAFDFGSETEINIQKESSLNGGLGFKQDLATVIKWFEDVCEDATAERVTTASKDGGMLPRTEYLTDTVFEEPLALSGGSRGISSNTSWQNGFDALLLRKVDAVVPLIDQDLVEEGYGSTATWSSVSQQLVDHVFTARGRVGKERGGYIGFRGTKTAYIAACNSLNDEDIQCTSQYPTVLNAAGTLEKMGPRESAVMAASMRAGVAEIGEPLTHKYLRCAALTQDPSWDPLDVTDASDLIIAGALFAETIPGKGTRWVRDITTWVKNDNLCYVEGSIRSVVRAIAYDIRTTLEDRFTGRKAIPATVANVKDVIATLLEEYREGNIIVDSKDPATGATIRAWHNLKVFTDGDVLRLNVGIFPVPGINFQLSEIFLQLPTQSA